MADPVLDYSQPPKPKPGIRWWSVIALLLFIPVGLLAISIILMLVAYLLTLVVPGH